MQSICNKDFFRESPHVCPTPPREAQGRNIIVTNPVYEPLTGPART